jgi:hypothetical protein
MNLNDKALLVQLSVRQWTARKVDRKVTDEVNTSNNATEKAGRYNKSLLPMNQYLADVNYKSGQIRNNFYHNTLPWGMDGMQILPSANYLNFMSDFRKQKNDWEFLVREFIANYDTLVFQAQADLGNLFNTNDYPSSSELHRKFSIDLNVMPVPANDFRVTLANEELTQLEAEWEARKLAAQRDAMKDVWNRLYEQVVRINERLANVPDESKKDFRGTIIETALDTCSMLTRLNFTDDPNLEAMRSALEGKLAGVDVDTLRNNRAVRKDVADTTKDIMSKMSVFMNGL